MIKRISDVEQSPDFDEEIEDFDEEQINVTSTTTTSTDRFKKLKGSAPWHIRGNVPVSASESPHWERVAQLLLKVPGIKDRDWTVEELANMDELMYPDGRRPRGRTIPRRLKKILKLVERGPNRSLGKGARFRVIDPTPPARDLDRFDVDDVEVTAEMDLNEPLRQMWLDEQIRKMMREE